MSLHASDPNSSKLQAVEVPPSPTESGEKNSPRWSIHRIVQKAIDSLLNPVAVNVEKRQDDKHQNPTPKPYDPMEEFYPGREYDLDVVQSENVGDCYFVAALYVLKHNEYFEDIIRHMVEKKGEDWIVHFPGDGKSVTITPRDLNGQMITDEKTGKQIHRKPIEGAQGDRVLERAYGRRKKERKEEERNERERKGELDRTFAILIGGNSFDVLRMFTGKYGRTQIIGYSDCNIPLSSHSKIDDQRHVERLLDEKALHPDEYAIVANTPRHLVTPYLIGGNHREFGVSERYFMDAESFFYQKHSYAITHVDRDRERVTVVNPHDTKEKKKIISYDTFMEVFSDIDVVELNREKIERDLKKAEPDKKRFSPSDFSQPEHAVYIPLPPEPYREQEKTSVEDVMLDLDTAGLTDEVKNRIYRLSPSEKIQVQGKYITMLQNARFGGRNKPNEITLAQQVVDYINQLLPR